jgi:nicotinamidase/pyrazinamidase
LYKGIFIVTVTQTDIVNQKKSKKIMRNSRLVICDPHMDLCDTIGCKAAIPIPGSGVALEKTATLIDRVGYIGLNPLTGISVILEQNRAVSICHAIFWEDSSGKTPDPYTCIYHQDIVSGRWKPKLPGVTLPQINNRSILEHCLLYTQRIESKGNYPLMIVPEYCLIGTVGQTIVPELMNTLLYWEREEYAAVDFVNKTSNNFVDQIGGLVAEMKIRADKSTGIDQTFLEQLGSADVIGFCGTDLSHGVRYTVDQAMKYLSAEHYPKMHILEDCCGMIPKIGELDFPALTKQWLVEVQAKGVQVIQSPQFLT